MRREFDDRIGMRSPGNEGPFIQQSCDAAMQRASKGVQTQGGRLLSGIALTSFHNGLYLSGMNGTVLVGGGDVLNWERVPLTDPRYNQIPSAIKNQVVRANLKKVDGAGGFAAPLAAGGENGSSVTAEFELLLGTTILQPARYPASGWILSTGHTGKASINFNDPVPGTWSSANLSGGNQIGVDGFLDGSANDSTQFYQAISGLTATVATFASQAPNTLRTGGRFRFYNVLEAMTAGTFYIDRATGYVYACAPLGPVQGANLSILSSPCIVITGANGITLDGLSFAGGRDSCIKLVGCSNITIKNCTVRGCGKHAIEADANCSNVIVDGCRLEDIGCAGIVIGGGSRLNLTSSGHVIKNTQFRRTGRRTMTQAGCIHFLGGHGHIVQDCLFDDNPGQCIYMRNLAVDTFEQRNASGVLIQRNTFRKYMTQAGDLGAIYADSEWGGAGVIIQDNLFINGVNTGHSGNVVGAYADNLMSGWLVQRNLFVNCDYATQINGGRSITIDKNVAVGCVGQAVQMNQLGVIAGPAASAFITSRMNPTLAEIPHGTNPWLAQFPYLDGIFNEATDLLRANMKFVTLSNWVTQSTPFSNWTLSGFQTSPVMSGNVATGNAGVDTDSSTYAIIKAGGLAAGNGLVTCSSQFLV